MTAEQTIINASEIISINSRLLDTLEEILPFIGVIKAVGIVFTIYITYLIVKGILNWTSQRRVKRIESQTERVEKKLNIILKRLDKIEELEEKIERLRKKHKN